MATSLCPQCHEILSDLSLGEQRCGRCGATLRPEHPGPAETAVQMLPTGEPGAPVDLERLGAAIRAEEETPRTSKPDEPFDSLPAYPGAADSPGLIDRVVQVLTPEQKKTWDTLMGPWYLPPSDAGPSKVDAAAAEIKRLQGLWTWEPKKKGSGESTSSSRATSFCGIRRLLETGWRSICSSIPPPSRKK